MKQYLAAIIIATAFSAQASDKPVKVFVLAGQSNMVGHGKVEYGRDPAYKEGDKAAKRESPGGIGGLRYLVTNPETRDLYKHLADGDKWVVRDDVWVYSTTAEDGEKGKLTVGFGKGGWFGPELGFGHEVGNFLDDDVLIIKTAWGGHSLGVLFRSPSSGEPGFARTKFKPEDVGKSYREMLNVVRSVCGNLGSHFPELKGRKVEFAGFGWHQGWNDGVAEMTAEYEENMVNFIKDVRGELGVKDLPFVIANTGMIGRTGKAGIREQLCEIQLGIGDPKKHPEFVGTVASVETRDFKRTTEQSPSGFGYHWNHNAESHYLVGQSMGKAMVRLLSEK